MSFVAAVALTPAAWAQNAPVYRWRNVPILGGGFVSGLIFHPTEPRLLYARTDIGGAYRWDEAARRWVPLTDQFSAETWNYTGIESLALDPTDPNRVYAAVGTYTNDWAGNGAMLRSTDRGNTWQIRPLPFKNGGNEGGRNSGERLAVDPNQPSRLLFGSRNHGMWESRDHGATWSKFDAFPIKARTNGVGICWLLFDKTSGTPGSGSRVVYAAVQSETDPAIYRSTDGGATWVVIDSPLSRKLLPQHGRLTADGKTLYVTYANHAGPNSMSDGAVLKLDLASNTWTDLTPVKPGLGDGFGYSGISLDPKRPDTLVVSTVCRWGPKDDVFRSTDGGRTWTAMVRGAAFTSDAPYAVKHNPHWMTDVEIDPLDPDRVWFVTGYGVWATRNASAADRGEKVSWSFDNHGLEECVILDLASPPAGPALLFSSMYDQDGFRHTSLESAPAGTFIPFRGGSNGLDVAALATDVVARQHQGRPRGSISRDNGVTWTPFAAAPATPSKGDKPNRIALSADGSVLLWGQADDVPYRSTDDGATWAPVSSVPQGCLVLADRVDPKTFYAYEPKAGSFYRSADGGATFVSAGQVGKVGPLIRAAHGRAGHLYAVVQGRFRLSTDFGVTWSSVESPLEVYTFGLGAPAPGSDKPTIFANGKLGGAYGIYRSTDGGKAWERINTDGQQFAHLHVIEGDPRIFGRVYLGSGSRGVVVGEAGR